MAYTDQLFSQNLRQLQGMGSGGPIPGQGGQDLGMAGNFWRTLLHGNRQALQQQAAPAVNAARDAADAAKKEQARMGTARTGGTAAANQQVEDEARKQMDTIIAGEQAQAADKLKSISDTELNTMMNSLGIGTSAAQQDIASRRAASAQMWGSLLGGAGALAGGAIAGGAFKGLLGGGGGGANVSNTPIQIPPVGGAPLPGGFQYPQQPGGPGITPPITFPQSAAMGVPSVNPYFDIFANTGVLSPGNLSPGLPPYLQFPWNQ